MKKTLLSLLALTFSVVGISQIPDIYETDQDGKNFYKHGNVLEDTNNKNYRAPMALALDWSDPDFDISNNPLVDSWDARMAVDNTGNVYVVYNDNHSNGLQKIMFRKKMIGQEWSDPIYVDKGGEIGGRNNHFPAIAASPNGDLHVTYNVWAYENARNYIGYSYYNATTDTWSDGQKISDAGGTVNHTNSHHDIYSTDDNLPVVVWGYDFRENQSNEEIYMKYFDGTSWSSDIPVSDISDGLSAGYPNIKSIGNNKAMLIYSEVVSGGAMELRYRIFDEINYDLSESRLVTSNNIRSNNYTLVSAPTEDVMVLSVHKITSPDRDVLNVFDYDRTNDAFSLSSNVFEVAANAGGLMKRIAMDCNAEGDCAVIYTDSLIETNSFLEYNKTTGFGNPLVINEENPGMELPSALFDPLGNLHVVWSDYRFNDGQGYDEREVFYQKGINTNLGINDVTFANIAIYPNPTKGTFTIDSNQNYTLEIFDVLGSLIKTRMILQTSTQIDTNLTTGTYFLRFSNGQKSKVKKLLVE